MFFAWLGNFLSGTAVSALLKGYGMKLEAQGSHEAKVVELTQKAVDLEIREKEINRDLKGQIRDRWYAPENLMAYLILIPYWAKVITLDNTIGSFLDYPWSTNALRGETAEFMAILTAFWLGAKTVKSVASILGAAFGRK
jgi:hypothetical protein